MPEDVIAELKIKDASKFTPRGRQYLADWLRDQAASLEKEADQYSDHYRASYVVPRRND